MQTTRERLAFIDALRGLVIILMALDHTSHYFNHIGFDPLDLTRTSAPLFMTRWITHLCAPIFIFLTGLSSYLYGQSVSRRELSRFLLTRGIWIVFLEISIISLSWGSTLGGILVLQVMWAIGISMIILAALVWLPRPWLAALALLAIALHNLLDSWPMAGFGNFSGLWAILHERHFFRNQGWPGVYLLYPLLPWFAVMALGYVVGPWMLQPAAQRERRLFASGVSLLLLFILLRWPNLYGDAKPWAEQARGSGYSLLSFINLSKYPPSLLFLCVTLGLGAFLLALLARLPEARLRVLLVYGRVSMFFYLIHVPLIHVSAQIWAWLAFGQAGAWVAGGGKPPANHEPDLVRVYLVWLVIMAILYFICRWYGEVKRRHPQGFLRYL